jgi:uncharacterized protein (TIGR01777 family)
MRRLFALGLGGRLGDGKQWMPWIHLEDEIGAIKYLIEQETLAGPVNLTAPHPARNGEFTKALGRALGRPAVLPAPAAALRLVLGEFAESLLASCRVEPRALGEAGFDFRLPALEGALEDLCGREGR